MNFSKLTSFIILVIAAALILFSYVVLLSEIKRMNRDKITKQEALNERINRVEMKMVDVQKLMSEDRIVRFAQDSLMFMRPADNLETIAISKEQVNQILKMINEKYD
ncbi:MAG: hypothetical protein A2499_16920 [Stygiobacter sp. RIFOXYC12_FULL_38_8]|nr:MAG: hypothetical protein A2299_11935 [Stygiobacter sp. RIFOXYB2_FULL_37_11]OGV10855.1 MAG: hypothetical protein A2237_06745 [Stygiobacter sp. RIFOXYA2_FULL_38_8]OGV16353.1 MAG: hypothetical protein A2440_04840 [Stygiobacter sp. RIFOXYC2_FULL_38_25]OGV28540.1 MAG: hypothetical protein A2499_16920 [Stygiobacter sp. RIFOXYC12_FULL_38_8]OGV81555.1 MAG: hypothetical protein A2X65_14995 [Stygiobacter sp. GWF2_38_21]OGV83653.1 MAG: hypothetical protein A3J88_05650 [Melioribacter sp. RIFOXYB12_FUL